MIVSALVAMDRNRGIGNKKQLPWKLSDDLKLFKQRTLGHHIVMGRTTAEGIGKALPGRSTIIVSRSSNSSVEGCDLVHSVEEALQLAASRGEEECFICGGEELYRAAMPFVKRIYLSKVEAEIEADRHFPPVDLSDWHCTDRVEYEQSERNQYAFVVEVWDAPEIG